MSAAEIAAAMVSDAGQRVQLRRAAVVIRFAATHSGQAIAPGAPEYA